MAVNQMTVRYDICIEMRPIHYVHRGMLFFANVIQSRLSLFIIMVVSHTVFVSTSYDFPSRANMSNYFDGSTELKSRPSTFVRSVVFCLFEICQNMTSALCANATVCHPLTKYLIFQRKDIFQIFCNMHKSQDLSL